ncbi:MAG TPA: threonylcarbamoyl-AMP synthase [Hadesarchaea archaeon]|nr:threonylcarbamoyl-AMP synthase [Hadesarchaea archaeon]
MVKILEVDQRAPVIKVIAEAAATIRAGGLVVYPTETVYGLGADACSDEAVAKVFTTKVRPIEDPISIAVSSLEMARQFTQLTPRAEVIFKKFLPGPLTVILEAKPSISKLLTAGTGKVGVRVPDHPVALKLLDFVGGPITSTSANITGKPAPSTVREALEQIGKSVDLALDAGKCKLGVPSTVVDLTKEPFEVLREGPITKEEILSG